MCYALIYGTTFSYNLNHTYLILQISDFGKRISIFILLFRCYKLLIKVYVAIYSHFLMMASFISGEQMKVYLEAENELVGILINRFGKEISIFPVDDNHFKTTVHVAFSHQFLGWILSLGNRIKIVAPQHAVDQMKEYIHQLYHLYKKHSN